MRTSAIAVLLGCCFITMPGAAELRPTPRTGEGPFFPPDAAATPLPLDAGFQYVGRTTTDAQGAYRFRTIVPGSYGRRPKHVHFNITHEGYRPLATEMQFEGDPEIAGDGVTGDLAEERHAQIIVRLEPPAPGSDARVARFPIVLER